MNPYFLLYLKFLLTSTNQHGVHSPFVYAYVTQCLYKRAIVKGSKSIQVFQKSRTYFKAERVKWFGEEERLNKISEVGKGIFSVQHPPFDLVFISRDTQHEVKGFLSDTRNIRNHTMVLIEGIYTSKVNRLLWERAKEIPDVRVSIDMFHCGVLFFRKEQVKEHFKIRI